MAALPKFGKFSMSVTGRNTKAESKITVCFLLTAAVLAIANIASFCCTYNHWSDNITSKAYIQDIAVPYFKETITAMRAANPGSCKPFGEQICILIVDAWWGWYHIAPWIKQKYPWIRLVFVPAKCTPVAQPMDAGVIAKLKGIVRRMYNTWVISLVTAQLKIKAAENVNVPADVPTCKTNLFKWLSAAVDELNKDRAGILHCWEKTKLLRAWEGTVQAEAARRAEELFPNLSDGDFLPADFKEDEEAGFMGLPFIQPEGDDEWVDNVPWEEVPEEVPEEAAL